MTIIKRSCCDPFVILHGLPTNFVQDILPKSADFLVEYEEQLATLNGKLQEAGVCEHYARQARIYLRSRCDSFLNCLAQGAEFLGWSPSYIEQMVNEGCLEDLLAQSTGPSL